MLSRAIARRTSANLPCAARTRRFPTTAGRTFAACSNQATSCIRSWRPTSFAYLSGSGSGGSSSSSSSSSCGAAIGLAAGAAMTATVAVADAAVDLDEVRKDIEAALEMDENYDDGSYGPVLVRLAWHASGTYCKKTKSGGSNGARMRFKPESDWDANAGLGIARQLLEPIKSKYPDLSYADLWTLAGVVAIEAMGGPKINWRPGRTDDADGSKSPPDGRLPDASQGEDHIRDVFYRMGFNDQEIVALAGAHALGRCHKNRSGYDGPWTRAPTTFSNEYFRLLLEEKWTKKKWGGPEQFENPDGDLMMLPADLAFVQDENFRHWVEVYAKDEERFFQDFAKAFEKLLELGVQFPNKGWCAKLFGWIFE